MPHWPRYPAALLAALALLAGCARPRQTPAPQPPTPAVRFLLVNDVYVTDTLRDGTGGLARVATLRDSLERTGPVLFVLAGDVLSPSLLSKWYSGRQMVDGFNAAGLDYATFGNHEFELSRDTLIARVGQSRFRWVSANCTLADGTPFPGVPPWDTLTAGGTRVGIFGLTLTGDYRSYVRCTDPAAAARQAAAELRRAGAQLVVALTHQTVADDSLLLAREPAVDLVLGGHEHEAHDVTSAGRRVLKADANSRSAQVVIMRPNGAGWATDARLARIERPLAFDSATQRVARAWTDSLVRRLGPERVIATTVSPLDARDALSRSQESALGDLVTDAMRFGTGTDVALINSGGLRLDDVLAAGPITNYQLESIFLFADETRAVTFPLTGARLRELIEHSVSDGVLGHGGFLQLSGVRFRYDPSLPSGRRIVGDLQRPDGRTIRPGDTVRVAMPAYPACMRGDGYVVPEAAAACQGATAAPRTVDLLLAHVAERLAGRVDVRPEGRIVRAATGAGSSR
jgi:5'-nucleotidase / UDP-sugar diphosphatase